MPENNAKRIVCLANSRKLGGRCVAGREVASGAYGGWIRPVSGRQGAAVSLEERRYQDGTDPQILDVINIQMIGPSPRLHQTENHLLNDQFYWQRERAMTVQDLPSLVERPAVLWANGHHTSNGMNDFITPEEAAITTNSLFLIRPTQLSILAQTEGGGLYPTKRRVRADFQYNRTRYRFMVTDPTIEAQFLAGENGVYTINDAYLCVSLGEPFDQDGRCYKLVATIILEAPLR